jgi:4-amino-4-deoxy-L-arabinose transferase-like glycosyltransferase
MLTFLMSTSWFLLYAPMDPDPHHDGVQLAPAVAVSQGLTVHSDAFSQYGPITVWLHALALDVFGDRLLTLRIATAVLLGISAALLFLLAREVGLPAIVAASTAFLWVSSAPIWMVWPGFYDLWPWPSVTFLALSLGSLLTLIKALGPDRTLRNVSILTLASGFLAGIAVITRPNYGLVFGVALVLVTITNTRTGRQRMRALVMFGVGGAVGVLLPLLELLREGAFQAFIDQSIVGPLGERPAGTSLTYNATTYLAGSLPYLAVVLIGIWLANRARNTAYFRLTIILVAGACVAIGTLGVAGFPTNLFVLTRLSLHLAISIQTIAPLYAAVVLTLIVLARQLIRSVRRTELAPVTSTSRLPKLGWVIVLPAGAALVQLYPVADPMHLWWSAPLPVLVLLQECHNRVRNRTHLIWLTAAITVPFILLGAVLTGIDLTSPRTTMQSGVLAGMHLRDKWTAQVPELDAELGQLQPGANLFLCRDGLWSVWNGDYLATGPDYVDWSFGVDAATDPSPKAVILCTAGQDMQGAQDVAGKYNMSVTREIGPLMLSEHTFTFWVYVLKP